MLNKKQAAEHLNKLGTKKEDIPVLVEDFGTISSLLGVFFSMSRSERQEIFDRLNKEKNGCARDC